MRGSALFLYRWTGEYDKVLGELIRADDGCRDREWQKWPVTIVTGAYGGYVVGKLLGGVLKGRKILFE